MIAISLAAAAGVMNAQPDPATRPFLRSVVEKYIRNTGGLQDYRFVRRVARAELDSNGNRKSWTASTSKVDFEAGVRATWLIARDDRPLTAEEIQKEEAEARRAAREWRGKLPAERKEIEEKRDRKARMERDFLNELSEALEFRSRPPEIRGGRVTLVYDFEPRAGYSPKSREAHVYEGTRGTVRVDQEDGQLVSLNAETFREVTMGIFLASVSRGSRVELNQVRLDSGVWLPLNQTINYAARILFKHVRRHVETQYQGYQPYSGPVWRGD
ncbi:hypothetical protein [Paludibaculum fermentans]|uniref:hypothetical protein n=1 Tax=Paludibaculum fermentans TaxID=1473598 RepID=UPI003EBAEEBD